MPTASRFSGAGCSVIFTELHELASTEKSSSRFNAPPRQKSSAGPLNPVFLRARPRETATDLVTGGRASGPALLNKKVARYRSGTKSIRVTGKPCKNKGLRGFPRRPVPDITGSTTVLLL